MYVSDAKAWQATVLLLACAACGSSPGSHARQDVPPVASEDEGQEVWIRGATACCTSAGHLSCRPIQELCEPRCWRPLQVELSAAPEAVAIGGDRVCALTNGDVSCWMYRGERRNGSSVRLPGPAVDVAAGGSHGCAALADGRVACWGDNSSGQLGSNQRQVDGIHVVEGVVEARHIVASAFGTCADTAAGVYCWGETMPLLEAPASDIGPRAVEGVGDVVELAAGGFHYCAVEVSGGVTCWGWNGLGQLGDGSSGWGESDRWAVSEVARRVRGICRCSA